MPRTLFTADLHFCHGKVIELAKRPFSSITEMDETMIRNWNAVALPDDDIHVVGDFAVTTDEDRITSIFNRLVGRKHLTEGNHDEENEAILTLPWASRVEKQRLIKVGDEEVFMAHYPFKTWPRARKGSVHLYGHMHGRMRGTSRSLDVGVDCWAFRPVPLSDIRRRLKTLPPDREFFAPDEDEATPAPRM